MKKLEKGGLIRTFTEDKQQIEYELYIVDVIGDVVFTKAFIKFPLLPKNGDYNTTPLQCWDVHDILFVSKTLEIETKKQREKRREREIDEALKGDQ